MITFSLVAALSIAIENLARIKERCFEQMTCTEKLDIYIQHKSFIHTTIKNSQIKEFLITIIHEIYHAMDAKRYGWKKFKDMYEMEMNLQIAKGRDEYKDNKYEIEAEKFGVNNWKKWYRQFNKDKLI